MNLKDFVDNIKRIDARCQAAYRQNNDIDCFYALETKLEDEIDQLCNANLYELCQYIDSDVVMILKAWDNWDDVLEDIRSDYIIDN